MPRGPTFLNGKEGYQMKRLRIICSRVGGMKQQGSGIRSTRRGRQIILIDKWGYETRNNPGRMGRGLWGDKKGEGVGEKNPSQNAFDA